MASIPELRDERLKKKAILEDKGINPYPATTARTDTIEIFKDRFTLYESGKDAITLAGRIMSKRGQGGLAFADIFDGSAGGTMQLFLKSDEMDVAAYELWNDTTDVGDFVEATGIAYTTKRGEQALFVSGWNMLAKSLLPLPEKWHGLTDDDERYRKRYLDILTNPELAGMVKKRSIFWNTMRTFLLQQDFLEVETPVLENTTGGAEARPFITHHNALDMEVYLRISAGELWQKKLLVAGIPKTFEIGRIFRNEGLSTEHLQDYTQLEFYMAFSDYTKGMEMVKALYRKVALETFGTTKFSIKGFDIDLEDEWKIYDFSKIIEERFGINPITETYSKTGKKVTELELQELCVTAGIKYERSESNITRTIDNLWKSMRKEISGPGFLIGIPTYMEPLAKKNRDNSDTVERFQVILAGSEVGKGFSELNDPIDQRSRFIAQQSLRDAGDDEAQMADMEYVEAMEYGMPPAFGFGVSERLFSFLLGTSVREAQLFPLLKPRE